MDPTGQKVFWHFDTEIFLMRVHPVKKFRLVPSLKKNLLTPWCVYARALPTSISQNLNTTPAHFMAFSHCSHTHNSGRRGITSPRALRGRAGAIDIEGIENLTRTAERQRL